MIDTDLNSQLLPHLEEANFELVSKQVTRLISECVSMGSSAIKWLRGMKGFVIVQKTEARRLVKQLLADVLQMSFSEFEQRLTDAGIKQTDGYRKDEKGENYKVRIYRAKKILSDSRIHQLETIEESNATDEFPKDLQQQKLNELKYGKSRLGNAPILHYKSVSENFLSRPEDRSGIQHVSLQMKLPNEQTLFATPLHLLKRELASIKDPSVNDSCLQQIVQEVPSLLCKDNNDYRNNYERCSQLIDETILNVLVAHKTRSIDANSEIIMSKITEIYDVLSENVENINSAAKYLLKRDTKIVQNSIKGDRYTPHLQTQKSSNDFQG